MFYFVLSINREFYLSILKFLVPEKVKYHVAKAYTPKRKAMKFLAVIEEGLTT